VTSIPDVVKLAKADAIVFGSPTYMGSAHGVFKLFLENAFNPAWLEQGWKDKLAQALPTPHHARATS
jgi:multimeric flavodoxin WrbA